MGAGKMNMKGRGSPVDRLHQDIAVAGLAGGSSIVTLMGTLETFGALFMLIGSLVLLFFRIRIAMGERKLQKMALERAEKEIDAC